MGHWSIDKEGEDTDEMWGDSESDITHEYFEYLLTTNPHRLLDKENLIEDIKVLVWEIYYELEVGRVVSTREVEEGIKFCSQQESDFLTYYAKENGTLPQVHIPHDTHPITLNEIEEEIGLDPECGRITSYLNYLKETNPKRMENFERLLEDIRILTYDVFHELKERQAYKDELEHILDVSLSHIK